MIHSLEYVHPRCYLRLECCSYLYARCKPSPTLWERQPTASSPRIPDIIKHMADVIVQAENEIFLATSA